MRKITIRLSEDILLKQLAKTAYTICENMRDDDAKMRHFIQSAVDEGHIDLILDRMDEAWADILNTLSAYTILDGRFPCGAQEPCICTNWDNETEESVSDEDENVRYEVDLWFPVNTFPDLGGQLMRLMSRYIILNGKAEWQAITRQTHSIGRGYGQDFTISEGRATKLLHQIKVTANMRTTNPRTKSYGY